MDEPKLASPISTMEVREGRVGNAFACERCRKHKVRCVPSDTTSVCQRCQKARVECVEHVARRRPAKARSDGQASNKVRDFDKKLEKLSAIVATMAPSPSQSSLPSAASAPSAPTETSQQTPISTASATQQQTPAPPVLRGPILPAPVTKSEGSTSFWESFNDTLSCLGRLDPVIRSISLVHMQMLLETYQKMVEYFPFVPLPRNVSCRELVERRPMLMFAVLTVASHDSVLLQLTLSREFRKVIMVKIMNGEKSLDILQGLLVFIAWHHHYMDTHAVSVPMLLQLSLGIANDLGLDQIGASERHAVQQEDARNREAKRAYLGCYFLACNIGLLDSGKARSLSYASTLQNYATELAASQEHKSDAILPVLVDVCSFMEDVAETFRNQLQQALTVRSQVKRLSDKWENIRLASVMQANDFKTLLCLQLAARIQLYQTAASVEFEDKDTTPWASGCQLSLRVTCLRSIEHFLDAGTKFASGQYELVSIVNWLHLISTVTNLGKLVLHASPLPGWDPVELQIAKTFEYFRDQLSAQMPRPRDIDIEDMFGRFRRITAIIRSALHSGPGRGSPSNATFELATGSGRTVSLLHDLPLPKPNGRVNGGEKLPSLWKVNPLVDLSSHDFHWKFLLGTV